MNLENVKLGPKDTAGIPLEFTSEGERLGYGSNPPQGVPLEDYEPEVMATFVKVVPRDEMARQSLITEASTNSSLSFTKIKQCEGFIE